MIQPSISGGEERHMNDVRTPCAVCGSAAIGAVTFRGGKRTTRKHACAAHFEEIQDEARLPESHD